MSKNKTTADINNMSLAEALELVERARDVEEAFGWVQGHTSSQVRVSPADTVPGEDGYAHLVGKSVFIRTVTLYYVGHLERVTSGELVLTRCSWVGDTGRWHQAITEGKLNEVEPYKADSPVTVNRGGIIDATEWCGDLPNEQK